MVEVLYDYFAQYRGGDNNQPIAFRYSFNHRFEPLFSVPNWLFAVAFTGDGPWDEYQGASRGIEDNNHSRPNSAMAAQCSSGFTLEKRFWMDAMDS